MKEAFVTLATNDLYGLGALTLAASLKRVNTAKEIVIMITESVSQKIRLIMKALFSDVIMVNVMDSNDKVNLKLLERPNLGITFTKLHCWRLTQFSKAVFLDADTIVLQNIDDLFLRDEFSAAPDVGWPDCFNSGVFVYCPNQETYTQLVNFASNNCSFDGADQGLLNMFFTNWSRQDLKHHLPFVYNCVSAAAYSYNSAYNYYKESVKVLHFIGPHKPWDKCYDSTSGQMIQTDTNTESNDPIQKWRDIFMVDIFPLLR